MINTAPILWTSTAAAAATGGTVSHADWTATGVSINTRTLQPGDLFIAIEGPNADGHDYIATAFEKGAVAACVCKRPAVLDCDAPFLVVDDTQQALEKLGVAARVRTAAKIIAVTGSVGKTGAKEALKWVLTDQGKTSASEGSLNNHWGLPLSLSRMDEGTEFGVLEMGMNHPGELSPLSMMATPHVCLITTVQAAHTEFFESTAEIAAAKAEIFTGAAHNFTAVLNRDIAEYDQLNAGAQAAHAGQVLTFGENIDADYRLVACDLNANGSTVTAQTPQGEIKFTIGAAGYHWVINALGILACVAAVGADIKKAATRLATFTPPQGRGDRFDISPSGGTFTLFDESYNASPAAMTASLNVLASQPKSNASKHIAILGDMLELGVNTKAHHTALAKVLIENRIDQVYLAGDAMRHLWLALPTSMQGAYATTSKELINAVLNAAGPGDQVMVKGSAGSNMGLIVAALKALDKTEHQAPKGKD